MQLKDKVAVITGGAQGIGAGCVRRMAADGAARHRRHNDEAGEALAAEVKEQGGQALFVHTDVSDAAAVDALFEKTLAAYGRVDILVNNAALVHFPPANRNFLELEDETWHKNMAVSLTGTFYCAHRAAKIMVKQVAEGTAEGGAIINMSSGGGSRAHRHLMTYDTSKGGRRSRYPRNGARSGPVADSR